MDRGRGRGGGYSGGRGGGGGGSSGRGGGGDYRGGGGGGNRGGGDYRGGGGGGNRGGGDYRGGGGGGYRGGGGGGYGGGPPRSTGGGFVDARYGLPKALTSKIFAEGKMGWGELEYKDGEIAVPPSKGPGDISDKKIGLITNNLAVKWKYPKFIIQYDVDIDKCDEDKKRSKDKKGKRPQQPRGAGDAGEGDDGRDPPRPKLWKKIFTRIYDNQIVPDNDDRRPVTDYMKSVYSPVELILRDFYLMSTSEIEDEPKEIKYICTVTAVKRIQMTQELTSCISDMYDWFIRQRKEEHEDLINVDRILNTALKTLLSRRFSQVGRFSFFRPPTQQEERYQDLGGGLVNWSGFSCLATLGWKVFINVDMANTAFLKGLTVYDALKEIGLDPSNARMSDHQVRQAQKLLKGCQVEYTTTGQNKLSRRITKVINQSPKQITFDMNGTKTNVEAYFRTQYKKNLQFPNGICLELGGKATVPAEFCKIRKGQSFNAKLSDEQTSKMIKFAAVSPAERIGKISDYIELIDLNKDMKVLNMGVEVSKELHQIEGGARVLPLPTLVYQGQGDKQAWLTPKNDGTWQMDRLKFVRSPAFLNPNNPVVKWGVLNLATERDIGNNIYNFVSRMCQLAGTFGLNLGRPDDVMNNYFDESANRNWHMPPIIEALRKIGANMLLVVMRGKDTDVYSTVKVVSEIKTPYGDKEIPILTQCLQSKNLFSFKTQQVDNSTVGNVLYKVNSKLGGTNYYVHAYNKQSNSPWEKIDILNVPVLIIGADVTHPGQDSIYPSLACVTGSIDRSGMPFQIHIQAQRKAEKGAAEVITGMSGIIQKFIRTFIGRTGHKPRRIIYYRDGVGNGQFGEVLNTEMQGIRDGCRSISTHPQFYSRCGMDVKLGETEGLYEPKITVVAVQKRHKVRFFVKNPADGVGRQGNAPPGTVVDVDIVKASNTDFYLLSHLGIQGTSRPTRYQVLWDDSDFSSNEIELLTYYLCFMYCRCTRSVSYPAPTYYAHLGATRAKVYADTLTPDVLQDEEKINRMIDRNPQFANRYPMHFV